MRITDLRSCQPVAPGSPPDWRTSLGQILVAVDTDAGLTGYGVGGGGRAGRHVVDTVLRDLLLGADPERIEQHWEAMYAATLPFGRKGIAIMALSGVDLALWDLRGKAEGRPVAELLGGRVGEPIPTYGTFWDDPTPEFAERYTAFKLHVEHRGGGNRVEGVLAAVERARKVLGPEPDLMLDAWMRWDEATTLAVAEAVRPHRIAWIEEPLPPDDLAGYARLVERCPIPIAGGEHEFTSRAFAELVDRGLHHVLQPDVCWCGGMTELVRIYAHANAAADATSRPVRVCPHRGAEPWGLHAIAALDRQPLAESGRPWMTWIGGQAEIERGHVVLGDRPGFGVEVDEAAFG